LKQSNQDSRNGLSSKVKSLAETSLSPKLGRHRAATRACNWHVFCFGLPENVSLRTFRQSVVEGFMTISGIVTRSWRPALSLAGAIALATAAGLGSAAATHNAAGSKTRAEGARTSAAPAPQQKPAQLRYFGGPKSVMSAR
jgi:hypothetical protein